MGIPQWKRAEFIIGRLKQADDDGRDIVACRSEIKRATESAFGSCHDCLLLAVYGLYKNGFIQGTNRTKNGEVDFTGFNGHESLDVHHVFDALELLMKDGKLTAAALKKQLEGDGSIYSFVVHYFENGLIRLERMEEELEENFLLTEQQRLDLQRRVIAYEAEPKVGSTWEEVKGLAGESMSLPLIITPEAEQDLAEAKAWHDRKRDGLGEEFVLCVEAALDHIRRFPEAATEVYPGVRRVVVRRFPYGIFYRVDSDQIAVLAVYHSKRDPRGWQMRADS